jgi:hypothetical protein
VLGQGLDVAPRELENLLRGHWEGNDWIPGRYKRRPGEAPDKIRDEIREEFRTRLEEMLKILRDPARQGTKRDRERLLKENYASFSKWLNQPAREWEVLPAE